MSSERTYAVYNAGSAFDCHPYVTNQHDDLDGEFIPAPLPEVNITFIVREIEYKPTAYPRSALNARVVAHIRENPAVLAVDAAVVDAERYGAGYSVLHLCAREARIAVLRLLPRLGPAGKTTLNALGTRAVPGYTGFGFDDKCLTPLYEAVVNCGQRLDDWEPFDLLVKAGAEVDGRSMQTLLVSGARNDAVAAALRRAPGRIAEDAYVPARDGADGEVNPGYTMLHLAAEYGQDPVVKVAVELPAARAKLDAKDAKYERSPLGYAAERCGAGSSTVRLLLDAGAYPCDDFLRECIEHDRHMDVVVAALWANDKARLFAPVPHRNRPRQPDKPFGMTDYVTTEGGGRRGQNFWEWGTLWAREEVMSLRAETRPPLERLLEMNDEIKKMKRQIWLSRTDEDEGQASARRVEQEDAMGLLPGQRATTRR